MTNLKPCPLCGSADVVLERISDGVPLGDWRIRCESCGIELGSFPVKETCVKRWNERSDVGTVYRTKLEAVRTQLNRWAVESRTGGWSTHQCKSMEKLAAEIQQCIDVTNAATASHVG